MSFSSMLKLQLLSRIFESGIIASLMMPLSSPCVPFMCLHVVRAGLT